MGEAERLGAEQEGFRGPFLPLPEFIPGGARRKNSPSRFSALLSLAGGGDVSSCSWFPESVSQESVSWPEAVSSSWGAGASLRIGHPPASLAVFIVSGFKVSIVNLFAFRISKARVSERKVSELRVPKTKFQNFGIESFKAQDFRNQNFKGQSFDNQSLDS